MEKITTLRLSIFLLTLSYITLFSDASGSHLRAKRQLGGYRFPGPRPNADQPQASATYESSYPKSRMVKREPQYEESPSEYSRSSSPGHSSPYSSRPSASQSYSAPGPYNSDQPSYPVRENRRPVSQEYHLIAVI